MELRGKCYTPARPHPALARCASSCASEPKLRDSSRLRERCERVRGGRGKSMRVIVFASFRQLPTHRRKMCCRDVYTRQLDESFLENCCDFRWCGGIPDAPSGSPVCFQRQHRATDPVRCTRSSNYRCVVHHSYNWTHRVGPTAEASAHRPIRNCDTVRAYVHLLRRGPFLSSSTRSATEANYHSCYWQRRGFRLTALPSRPTSVCLRDDSDDDRSRSSRCNCTGRRPVSVGRFLVRPRRG